MMSHFIATDVCHLPRFPIIYHWPVALTKQTLYYGTDLGWYSQLSWSLSGLPICYVLTATLLCNGKKHWVQLLNEDLFQSTTKACWSQYALDKSFRSFSFNSISAIIFSIWSWCKSRTLLTSFLCWLAFDNSLFLCAAAACFSCPNMQKLVYMLKARKYFHQEYEFWSCWW